MRRSLLCPLLFVLAVPPDAPAQSPSAQLPAQLPSVQSPSVQSPAHIFFRVTLSNSAPGPLSGRVLIFVKQGTGAKEVDSEEFAPQAAWVTAREVHNLAPGASVEVDATVLAYPASFASMAPGTYQAQAVLDPAHTYNYAGRGPGDWVSPVLPLPDWNPASSPEPTLTLDRQPTPDPLRAAAHESALAEASTPNAAEQIRFESPSLTRFWGAPTFLQAWVILPPGYAAHPAAHYPTAYWTFGFGGTLDSALATGMQLRKRMLAGSMPPMIWVMLDESCSQGTHEFADSVNNGPWGTALTAEFIPWIEARFRMDAKPTGRLLNGHSSGGWATLQLQVNYPQVFGGTWSTSPDPSDFHNFTNVDLYAPAPNFYHDAHGKPFPIMRDHGQVLATLEQFSRLEAVLGPYGGQISSFDWVFSPRSVAGGPQPLFDRATGRIDPAVATYWQQHYDLANRVEQTWPTSGPLLRGRIHLIVGTADTFYLDGAARLFEARLQKLGAEPHFTYLPDKTHFDLYNIGQQPGALFDRIGAEMYAVARPGVDWKAKPDTAR